MGLIKCKIAQPFKRAWIKKGLSRAPKCLKKGEYAGQDSGTILKKTMVSMHYLIDVSKDLAIIAASIVTMLVSLYLFLVIVQWGIKLKHGNREQDGLTTLWQECLKNEDSEKPVQNQKGEEG